MIHLYLIRHGEIPGNREKRYIGWTDQHLTEEGAAAIRKKKEAGFYPEADLVLASPLTRCVETAAIICPEQTPVLIDDWKEMSFGAFEGANYLELSGDPRYQAWIDSGGEGAFPGGEDKAGYCARILRGFEFVKKMLAGRYPDSGDKTVLAAVHMGTIKVLISELTGEGYFDVRSENGEGYEIELSGTDGDKHVLSAAAVRPLRGAGS